ncbi:hypothetical protein BKM25_28410 [Pseudomonas avellanae]|uniref:hypothetical protein n=1 Tax=Pseudomonas syringae group TaxID=136849 RepID=UPI000C096143|nr:MULTISPECIES: hypothetical protein [Pseudomonas syringae group]PHN47957.1 hypothetical protein AO261_28655 [Pseudomonas avellanae]POR66693.1 hypothetical protein BKM25_28410 [Pseudomonas avellanae]
MIIMKPAYPPLLLQMSPAYTPRPLKNLFTANGCWADLLEAGGLRQIEGKRLMNPTFQAGN